jgi:FKBP-type peptidyl-prolyl cis-trans isomerase (trigger factor)
VKNNVQNKNTDEKDSKVNISEENKNGNNMDDNGDEKKRFDWGRIVVPGIIAIILITFAGIVYWAKVIKPDTDVDNELGIKTEDYISVGDITGLSYELTQEQWDECVNEDTQYYIEVDRAAKETDQIEYNYTAYINGKKIDDLTMQEQSIDIGSYDSGILKKFSDKIIGHKSGDKVKVVISNGEEANELSAISKDYTGKKITFKLKINYVSKLKEYKVTDKWVKNQYYEERGVSTVDEFYEWEKEYLIEEVIKVELWNKALDKVTLKAIPSELQQEVIDSMNADNEAQAEYESMSVDEYRNMFGLTDEKMQENYNTELKSELLLWQLVKDLDLTASKEEIEQAYEDSYLEANMDSVEEMKEKYDDKEMKELVLLQKAQDYVFENANIKYSYKINK